MGCFVLIQHPISTKDLPMIKDRSATAQASPNGAKLSLQKCRQPSKRPHAVASGCLGDSAAAWDAMLSRQKRGAPFPPPRATREHIHPRHEAVGVSSALLACPAPRWRNCLSRNFGFGLRPATT